MGREETAMKSGKGRRYRRLNLIRLLEVFIGFAMISPIVHGLSSLGNIPILS